jgi:SAM-dependent methyltransferase
VIEAASNDGYLLQYYQQAGVRVLGIEPALNVAAVARERGIPTVSEFFGRELATQLDKADVFVAANVLAHVPDVNGFVAGIAQILKPTGVAIIETPYAREMIDKGEFDTIYHEHLFYYSITALEALFARHGLAIDHVEPIPIHGGSIRLRVRHGHRRAAWSEPWARDPAYYAGFADRIWRLRDALYRVIDGKDIAGYGAAAKGTVLLNCFGIRSLRYVVDRNPVKQGRYVPGVRTPIVPPDRLLVDRPDYVLVLAWNIAREVLEQQREYRDRGGRFIIPLPELSVV